MFYKGQFIARIPNDENAKSRIEEYKAIHGQLRLCGRHPRRKQAMAENGLKRNFMGDIPYRIAKEIVIYRKEGGMTYRQFQALEVGNMIEIVRERYYSKTGIVLNKKGKNQIKIAIGDRAIWTTRQKVILHRCNKR
jgi:hypothetical protein